jgi:fructose-bisphosphate aldolase, class I
MIGKIRGLLGEEADYLLDFDSPRIAKNELHLPGPDWVSRIFIASDRPPAVLRNLESIFSAGRLGGTGYLSILPVDQGIEHSAGASFAPNREYFDPENIVKLAMEAGCNAVASSLGVLGIVSRKYAHKIPFIMKINHNELLAYPNKWDQILFASVEQAFNLGAVAVGATIYFGAPPEECHITEISRAFELAHGMGMATVLWAYLRNAAFTIEGANYETSADLTGQADYLGANIEADLIKQKQPEMNGGYPALNRGGVKYGRYDDRMYSELASDHPIDLTRYQVVNQFMGRIGLINSGGASGKDDMAAAVRAAVINKRAGGMGLISGRKTFQKPIKEGVEIFHAIQDVYLSPEVTVA